MDISFIVVLWVIITIVQTINERKKAPPPPEIPPEFEIPTLANAPNKPAEVHEIDLEELYRRRKQAEKNIVAAKTEPVIDDETKNIKVDITPESAMNAIILSEILDKPKSLRRKKF